MADAERVALASRQITLSLRPFRTDPRDNYRYPRLVGFEDVLEVVSEPEPEMPVAPRVRVIRGTSSTDTVVGPGGRHRCGSGPGSQHRGAVVVPGGCRRCRVVTGAGSARAVLSVVALAVGLVGVGAANAAEDADEKRIELAPGEAITLSFGADVGTALVADPADGRCRSAGSA